jgi:hypothetical protein
MPESSFVPIDALIDAVPIVPRRRWWRRWGRWRWRRWWLSFFRRSRRGHRSLLVRGTLSPSSRCGGGGGAGEGEGGDGRGGGGGVFLGSGDITRTLDPHGAGSRELTVSIVSSTSPPTSRRRPPGDLPQPAVGACCTRHAIATRSRNSIHTPALQFRTAPFHCRTDAWATCAESAPGQDASRPALTVRRLPLCPRVRPDPSRSGARHVGRLGCADLDGSGVRTERRHYGVRPRCLDQGCGHSRGHRCGRPHRRNA